MNFTDRLAHFIKEKDFDLRKLVIILPSERASKYLVKSLVSVYEKPIFSPEITTIDRWVKSYSPPIIDKTRLLLYLFEIYQKTPEGKEATFEDFLTWGTMLLSDFEDIDRYMLDHAQVFKNLKAIKELESWNIDDDKLSVSQQKFMEFWDRIPVYYEGLHLKVRANDYITSALAYRKIAEDIDLIKDREGKHFIFAGFNALSTSELTIIKKLKNLKQADYIVDVDDFYFKNQAHEAGTFIRKNLQTLEIQKPTFVQNELLEKELAIDIVECAQHTGQVKVAATELAKLSQEEINKTLILLADESLISSMVKNIPANVGKANITLGLPLNQTPVKTWVELLFEIQENKGRFKTQAIYHKDLQRIINHVFTISAFGLKEKQALINVEQETIRKNKIFQNVANLPLDAKVMELLELMNTDWKNDWQLAMDCVRKINNLLLNLMPSTAAFERNILAIFDEALVGFQQILSENIPYFNLRSFKLLFFQHWNKKSIAYHGNPINGLQIMGLLETRLLDFENIMVLGLNEGKLPSTNPIKTIIPMDLRYGLGLPSTRDKQGIYAHHFYRLLNQCKKLTLTYTTAIEQIGSNEASRYITQLELELTRSNPKIHINRHFYNVPFPQEKMLALNEIQKTPEIITRLDAFFERSLSASAMNKYLACPLDFYYRYLADLGEDQDVEEELEANTFGTFIHDTLEELYTPYAHYTSDGTKKTPTPPPLSVSGIDTMISQYKQILHKQFMKHFNGDESLFLKGKNLLSYEMAMAITRNLLMEEREFVNKSSEPIDIIMLEMKLTKSIEIEINGTKKLIHFSGLVDRIDKVGNNYRVIDYKSGKVTEKDVKFKQLDTPILSFKNCKHAVQLALYCLFFKERFNHFPAEAKIISLVDVKANYNLNIEDGTTEDVCNSLVDLVTDIITELYETEEVISHNPDSKYCSYC
jgi:CRISPR/Cas system-associated exonuclease Cas4 (RecB family)